MKSILQKIILVTHYPFLFFLKVKNSNVTLPNRYILACNHPNKLDGALIYLLFYWKFKTKLKIFAHEKYFNNKLTKIYLESMDCIKVKYEKPGESLNEAYNNKTNSFCIFIEGKCTKEKIKPKTGAVRLSNFHNIPILPIRIINTKMNKIIIIGTPLYYNDKDIDIHKNSEHLLESIYSLNIK